MAAAPKAVLLIVADPPDPLADVARLTCPQAAVLSTGTYLDSQRFRVHLGKHFSVDPAHVEAQVIGDYVGKRFATFTDDTSVTSYFLTSLRIAFKVPESWVHVRKAELALNVTNLGNVQGWSTISIGSATNSFSAYPIAPRQWFLTFSGAF